MKLTSILIGIFSLLTSALSAVNVAVIYSGWPDGGKSYLTEFDSTLEKMGYKFKKFENKEIPQLTSQLSNYDMVIVSTVGNLENTVELKPYVNIWKDYIKNGGILFICDANYTSVLQSFINHFGRDFALFSEHCSSHTNPIAKNKIAKAANHPLLTFPAAAYKTATTVGHWSHFTNSPAGWITLEKCVDNKPITVAKPYGNGLIAVTVHSNLRDTASGPYAQDFLTNMHSFTTLKKLGMTVVSAKIPSGLAQNIAAVTIKTAEKDMAKRIGFNVTYSVKNGFKETAAAAETDGKTVYLTAPVDFNCRGDVSIKTVITRDGKEVLANHSKLHLPEYLAFKARRIHLYPDMPEILLYFNVMPANTDSVKSIKWNINGKSGEDIAINGNVFSHPFDVSSLPSGKHTLNMEYVENGKKIGSYSLEFFKHDTPVVGVRQDGVLTINGEAFFPMGFYHVSRNLPLQGRMDMIRDIAKYGYNCVHVSIKNEEKDNDSYKKFLDECYKRGIFVITEFSDEVLGTVKRFKNHPAVLGWNPGDEPAGNGVTPEEMFNRYSSFKQEDPNHIVYTVICLAQQYKNYASGSDVLAPDPYPVPISDVDGVFKIYSSAYREARKYGTTMWSVPQCFGNYASWTRPPNGKEYRVMLYLAIMAGAKGFINYTYNDGGFYLPTSKELYETCKKIPAELKEFIPFIINGKRTVIRSTAKGIYVTVWEMNGKRVYAVVNASPSIAFPVQIYGNFDKCRIAVGKLNKISADGKSLKATIAPMDRALIFCD